MRIKVSNMVLVAATVFMLSAAVLAGCSGNTTNQASTDMITSSTSVGVLCVKVNPEIAISYDANGLVTGVSGRNAEAQAIVASYTGYQGKGCKQVVNELLTAIGNAGYYVDDVDGSPRKVTIEIESGSKVPSPGFMDDVASGARTTLEGNNWTGQVNVVNQANTTTAAQTTAPAATTAATAAPTTTAAPAPTTTAAPAPTPTTTAAPAPAPTTRATTRATTKATTRATTRATTTRRYVGTDYYNTDYGPYGDGVTDYGRTDYGRTNYSDYRY